MNNNKEICLLNDSFPPQIDGVANTVVNYARVLRSEGKPVSVVTPNLPEADDSGFDYPVIRYPSVDLREYIGYTVGNPFSISTLSDINKRDIGLLHSHCPMMSNMVARSLKASLHVPLILTYHTKFDIDIANVVKLKGIQQGVIKAMIDNVSAADELWVVSDGAGKNIQNLGYEGSYVVMPNGVDIPKITRDRKEIAAEVKGVDIPEGMPVFLLVGRLMWYKGIRIILDAMAALKSQNLDFRMVFIGSGGDEAEVKRYVEELKLGDRVIFTGAIHDRELLTAWYCRADLLLFPSTYDTNGLVVREAAACGLGSVLVKGSCAAEGVTNGVDGLLIDENAASLAVCLARIMDSREAMGRIGQNASDNLYYSWDDSVKHAMERYDIVIDKFNSGRYRKRKKLTDASFRLSADIVEMMTYLREQRRSLGEFFDRYW
ncbi:MAG: glycosyltransferase [Eubacteriales bacterium]|nr:glycosyltransferase [Eubacteriales bacterium]